MNEIELARFVDGVAALSMPEARHLTYLLPPSMVTEREVDIINAELERREIEAHVLRAEIARMSFGISLGETDLWSGS